MTNPLKALELRELWKAKPDLPEISQTWHVDKTVGAVDCSTTKAATVVEIKVVVQHSKSSGCSSSDVGMVVR